MSKEIRFSIGEFRAAGTPKKPMISGYAATYGTPAIIGVFDGVRLREVIQPHAFKASVARQDDCYCAFDHDTTQPLGRVRAGNLRLRDDSNGLYFECDIDPDVSYAMDVYRNVKNGTVDSCSFGFADDESTFEQDPEQRGGVLRKIKSARVFDVSPVTNPAYKTGTSVKARSSEMFPDGHEHISLRFASALESSIVVPVEVPEVSPEEIARMAARVALAKLQF